MKKSTSIIVAAALIAPSAAYAQRHTTPAQAERHAANLAEAESHEAKGETYRSAGNDERQNSTEVKASKAGKINTAKANDDGAS
ncbi:MAG: hypothetical protein AAF941_04095 [Pseudomonadota bacterium]